MQALALAGPSALGIPVEAHTVHPSLPRPIPTLDTRRWDLWHESTCLCCGHCAVMRGHGSVLLTALVCSVFCVRGGCSCSFWLVGAAEMAEGPQAGRGVQGWSHGQWNFKITHPNALYSSELPLRAVHYIHYFSIAKTMLASLITHVGNHTD